MAGALHSSSHGDMDIADQKATYSGFLTASVWGVTLVLQTVALLTFAFAIGLGWWAGFTGVVVIGVGAGLIFKTSPAWWAVQVALFVLLGLGGLIVPALAGMMG